jgi:hypothetical protein
MRALEKSSGTYAEIAPTDLRPNSKRASATPFS